MDENFNYYLNVLKKLNRAYNKGLGKAPHKPILLISVIQLIRNNVITTNRIFITPELVLSFKSNWNNLVNTGHTPNFSLPFFHLKNESFWTLTANLGFQESLLKLKSTNTFKKLKDTIAFAEINKQLFLLLKNNETNLLLEQFLIKEYFGIANYDYLTIDSSKFELKIEDEILNEDKTTYQSRINELHSTLDENEFEEEIFIRGGLFKKTIPKIYNYQCCISGMKIDTTTNAQMVDACHIIPFSISHDDTIPNGLSLSPNLHRAFDRGLITINKDYIVRISPTVTDNKSVYSISQFNGNQIILPIKTNWYPSTESLIWHTKEVFQL
ncbi:HNH endonuclease [Lutibacter sp.]|uniref:HNH endonuclease n=1 Tax=Lutibacter sp. TaxID=1925666 RepID=UPI0027370F65|nr:HNH endonuclease [Lutibacter sp.]MDP3314394.1 HNH endonuclease [Lutibacter sp.]